MKDKESYFISLFDQKYIGDDGAIIGDSIYSKDLFCEDIHFRRSWMTLKQIAYKSMLINISDAIVMNAKVKYALIGIKIPSSFTKNQLNELYEGFKKASTKYNFEIIGGDTVAGDKLDISITLISKSNNPLTRDGMKVGEIIGFTGELGSVAADLKTLLNGGNVPAGSKFIQPILRDNFFYKASEYFTTALDISDGLSKDLSRLSKINSKGFEFFKELDFELLCSGEEYEILFSTKEENLDTIKTIAKATNTPVTFFAKVIEGSYKSQCKENHF
jgi:thiamine-monophosphate kinase